MKKLFYLFFAGSIVFFLQGCEKSLSDSEYQSQQIILQQVPLSQSTQSDLMLSQKKKHPVPFRASWIATATAWPPQPNEEKCGVGFPVVNFQSSGEGNALHLGSIEAMVSSCVDTSTNPVTIYDAKLTMIAANGDELYLQGSGEQGSTFEILGGTGRFENATGYFTGTFQPIQGSFPPSNYVEGTGEIQY